MRAIAVTVLILMTGGCSTTPTWLPTSGPSKKDITEQKAALPIPVIDINESVTQRLLGERKNTTFAQVFPSQPVAEYLVGPGDVLQVSIWEAPPATLFGQLSASLGDEMGASRATTFPEQMVNAEGTINVPFAGSVKAASKTPREIEEAITRRLTGKAHQPQVLVRITKNTSSNVTVVGEVNASTRMPLTAKGERLLDTLAAAGGVKQAVSKITIQLTRGGQHYSMPLDSIIRNPNQNIMLRPGDVVTAIYQSSSFIALGATGKNQEVEFEAKGISLTQALGRIGGSDDQRADAQGLFIFRFEDPSTLGGRAESWPHTAEGKIPVIYRLDLKDPRSFLVAQDFPINNRDVLYMANAPAAELQKFLNILTSSIFTVSSLVNTAR
ncbi:MULTISPECIES: polysaccharide biosynthesis/export family protein [Burkholderia]|uniref:polysaccharide biosynthesis/export family protein n=1 Tax=Burkholderia TaxID=32008 RepID=UPI000759D145|nr:MULTISPECIES: polysaccharide biosynthesis/export family protein [Burkholderia]AOJ67821.1 capsular biosynthesis protein [Burkholderia savannae]KVG43689.1 capsular biosynthesis protein [Burkholderia sp. MSMB0265]KVG88852.1 capsular biosynthesis protein [Burkholderia sp. MSMB2040]KVG93024.1 capsular biosynthesis protein [Burkholderia sp. MSMB2042]KVH02161.1 capsular biosynthesis protein [Burkholderia sp. MSMB2041]